MAELSEGEAKSELRSRILDFLQEADGLDEFVEQLLVQFPGAEALRVYQEESRRLMGLLADFVDDLDEGRWPTSEEPTDP